MSWLIHALNRYNSGEKWNEILRKKNPSQIINVIRETEQIYPELSIPFLDHLSRHVEKDIRRAVAVVLGKFSYSDAIPILPSLIVDPIARVREAATESLGYFGAPEVLPLIGKICTDSSVLVRRAASKSLLPLVSLAPECALPICVSLVLDTDIEVSSRALYAVGLLRGTSMGSHASELLQGIRRYRRPLYQLATQIEIMNSKFKRQVDPEYVRIPDSHFRALRCKREKLKVPNERLSKITTDVNRNAHDERHRHLYGWFSAMLKGNELKKGYITYISTLKDHKYHFSIVISPHEELGVYDLGRIPKLDNKKIELAVVLLPEDDDYIVIEDNPPVKKLYLPPAGKSTVAQFTLRGLKQGKCFFRILVYHRGSLVMRAKFGPICIKAIPGEINRHLDDSHIRANTIRTLTYNEDFATIADNIHEDRLASLLIEKRREKLILILFHEDRSGCHLAKSQAPEQSARIEFGKLHCLLKKLIDETKGWTPIFKNRLKLQVHDKKAKKALGILREAGELIWSNIFHDPATESVRRHFYDIIKEDGKQGILQIVSDTYFLPWQLIYIKGKKTSPEAERFLGMRFGIEHTLAAGVGLRGWSVKVGEEKMIAFINDRLPKRTLRRHYQKIPSLINKYKEKDVIEEFKRVSNRRSAIYFYCHAKFSSEEPDKCWIKLTDDKSKLTILYWRKETAADKKGKQINFKRSPLIFLNACESGRVQSSFYQSFVGFLLRDKKAGGVIGTETLMPANFATDFAIKFWDKIKRKNESEPISRVLLELRRSYWEEYNNPLGMLYSLYSNADLK
jgi:hypothetical protein